MYTSFLLFAIIGILFYPIRSVKWNQTEGYEARVHFDDWSNFKENGGCVTCPYTCVKPKLGPNSENLLTGKNSNKNIPEIYYKPQRNGCCYANPRQSKVMPSCSEEANPKLAEDCGFLHGPSVGWKIRYDAVLPGGNLRAMLFASIDCLNFWAIGETVVRQTSSSSKVIKGKKVINGGCYGNPMGESIVLVTCLSSTIKYDKGAKYKWDDLAVKCMGLAGKCTRTNSIWGKNLKCCTDPMSLENSFWDINYEDYHKQLDTGVELSGLAVTGIVFGGVAFLLLLVHCGRKIHQRRRETKMLREQENQDDYEEIVTPLTMDQPLTGASEPQRRRYRAAENLSLEISLTEGDRIFRKQEPEVLFEGQLH